MKKWMMGIVTVVGLSLSSCANKSTAISTEGNNKYLCGAYADYQALTDEDRQVFESTYHYDLQLTPQSVATQVVAGINYKFICTDESGNDVKVVVFKPLPNQGQPRVSSIETVAGQETPAVVAVIAQVMYDDILSKYQPGNDGQKYAFGRYASTQVKNLLDTVDKAITKGEIEPMMYGWDCDPWIMAQDWSQPRAKVAKAHDLTDHQCMVDVEVSDEGMQGNPTTVTLSLVKEGHQWKVDDFATAELGDKTFTQMLKADYEAAKTQKQ